MKKQGYHAWLDQPPTQRELVSRRAYMNEVVWSYDGLNPPGTTVTGEEGGKLLRITPGQTVALLAIEYGVAVAKIWKRLGDMPTWKEKEGTLTPEQLDEWHRHTKAKKTGRGRIPALLTDDERVIAAEMKARRVSTRGGEKYGKTQHQMMTIRKKARAEGLL